MKTLLPSSSPALLPASFTAWAQLAQAPMCSQFKRFSLLGLALLLALALALSPGVVQAQSRTILYVDRDAPGPAQDGASWATAYRTLQAALDVTNGNDGTNYEIWVAEGVYYPDEGPGHVDNSRDESFRIRYDNVQLYGGFAATETLRTQRNWTAHPTVLSGDSDGDGTAANNAYHVVYVDGVTSEDITGATVLDGFTITGGNGDGETSPNDSGGGVYCDGAGSGHACSPALANTVLSGNGAVLGGGMYNDGYQGVSSPALTDVTVSDNLAAFGGGIYNHGESGESSPALTHVMVSGNRADYGGGMYNNGYEGVSSPVLTHVTVSDNSATDYGGGMYNDGIDGGVSSPLLTNVTISGNRAALAGGGIYNKGSAGASSPLLTNVIISGNSAGSGGGMVNEGFFHGESSPLLTNVTLSGNHAVEYGGAMYSYGYLGASNAALKNSIMWGNTAGVDGSQIYTHSATTIVSYSNVQGGGYVGSGNLDVDPLFATPISGTLAPTTTGDYRLLPGSPAIDTGMNTGAPATDVRGLPRPVNLVTDMGAYEVQGFSLAITGGDNQTAGVGATFAQSLTMQLGSAIGEPVGPGGVITFMPPPSGPGLSVTAPFAVATDEAGAAAASAAANGLGGSYGVTVTAGGVSTPVVFHLTNMPVYLTAASTGSGSGAVTSDPAGIDCGRTCTAAFDYSTAVTLTASADTGSTFDGWSGACSGTGPCTVTMTETKVVTAAFTLLLLAFNDAAGVLEGQAVDVAVLANDVDPTGRGLAVLAVTQPAHGAGSIDASRTRVRYVSTAGFNGEDSFTYTVQDANGLTSTALVAIVIAPLAHTEAMPQLALLVPATQQTAHFTSSLASVQVDLPAAFYTGTVAPTDVFFLAYTPVMTPTEHTLAPPAGLRFGNFEFHLTTYLNATALHDIHFAQPILLTIHYDPALLQGLNPPTLQLQFRQEGAWSTEGITLMSHDVANATLVVASDHLSDFAFFAAPAPTGIDVEPEPAGSFRLYLPAVSR